MLALPDFWRWMPDSKLLTGSLGNYSYEANWQIGDTSLVIGVHDPLDEDTWPFFPVDLEVANVRAAHGEYRRNMYLQSEKQKPWVVCGNLDVEGEGGYTHVALQVEEPREINRVEMNVTSFTSNTIMDLKLFLTLEDAGIGYAGSIEII